MFAIMPPPEFAEEIHRLRLEFSKKFGFVKALKPPVHITIVPPFSVPAELCAQFEQRMQLLAKWAQVQTPFEIDVNGFDFFEQNHPVTYLDVAKNNLLETLYAGFIKQLSVLTCLKGLHKNFRPHLTIGYRDVTADALPGIKEEYTARTCSAAFPCQSIFLWKHNHTNWQVAQEYTFTANDSPKPISLLTP